MNHSIAIASGKGGVGKTLLASSIGQLMAAAGKTVLMVDLDLGASNLHSCLGIPNTNPGIGSFLHGKVQKIEDLIINTAFPRLYLIPGDQLLPGSANFPFYMKRRLLDQFEALVADFIILDLGAGSAYNTVDFFLGVRSRLVVSSAEPTAILNSYAFMKTAAYRLLVRSFPRNSRERNFITEYLSERIEGTTMSFAGMIRELGAISSDSEQLANARLAELNVQCIINMARHQQDVQLGARLREVTRVNIGLPLEFIGIVPYTEYCYQSILKKTPMSAYAPQSPFTQGLIPAVQRLIEHSKSHAPSLYDGDDDLSRLEEAFLSADDRMS